MPIFSMLYHDIICHTSESSYYKQPVVKGLYFLMHATVFIHLNFWNGHIKPDIQSFEWKKKSLHNETVHSSRSFNSFVQSNKWCLKYTYIKNPIQQ